MAVTECACCGRTIHLGMDSDLAWYVEEKDASPMLFSPSVDLHALADPSIIDAY